MRELTDKQQQILSYIKQFINRHHMAPSVNEIATFLEITSATAFSHLMSLQRKGFITRSGKARSIILLKDNEQPEIGRLIKRIPIIGRVSAGAPLLAEEHIEGEIDFDLSQVSSTQDSTTLFALKVNGDSMQEMGIVDGDLLIAKTANQAKNGDIVIALIDDQTTVKSIIFHQNQIELRPANHEYASQFYNKDQVAIQGIAIALQRVL